MSMRQGQYQPVGQWITKERRLAIYLRDGFACLYCGTDLRQTAPSNITLDHVIPRSRSGKNTCDNIVTACRSCNSARGNKTVQDYAPGGAMDRIMVQLRTDVNMILAKAILSGEAGDPRLEDQR